MFDEYFDKYALSGAGETTRKQIKADKAAVLERVRSEGGEVKRVRPARALKIAAVCMAAALCLGVTAEAVSGRLGEFISNLSKSEIYDYDLVTPIPLPAVNGNEADISDFYSCPEADVIADGDISVKLAGLYNDNNTAVVTLLVSTDKPFDIENDGMPIEAKLTYPDGQVINPYPMVPTQRFTKGEKEGQYYVTYYFADSGIGGGRMTIEADGIYTKEQEQLRSDRYREFSLGHIGKTGGLKYQEDLEAYNKMCEEKFRELLQEIPPLINGNISISFDIPMISSDKLLEGEYNGIAYRMGALSLFVSKLPYDIAARIMSANHIVYLKDGTVISDDWYYVPEANDYYAMKRGNMTGGVILSFHDPIALDDVEKIVMRIRFYDNTLDEVNRYFIDGATDIELNRACIDYTVYSASGEQSAEQIAVERYNNNGKIE